MQWGKYSLQVVQTKLGSSLVIRLSQLPGRMGHAIEQFRFREALQPGMDMVRAGNKHSTDTAPWHLIKSNQARLGMSL